MVVAPLKQGMARQWVRCKQCGKVSYYDYQRHSLSNPVRTLPCGHGLTIRFDDAVDFLICKPQSTEARET